MSKPRKRQRAMPSPDAFAFSIKDAEAMGGPSRSTIYALAKADRLKLIQQEGLPTRVDGNSLRELLKQQAGDARKGVSNE